MLCDTKAWQVLQGGPTWCSRLSFDACPFQGPKRHPVGVLTRSVPRCLDHKCLRGVSRLRETGVENGESETHHGQQTLRFLQDSNLELVLLPLFPHDISHSAMNNSEFEHLVAPFLNMTENSLWDLSGFQTTQNIGDTCTERHRLVWNSSCQLCVFEHCIGHLRQDGSCNVHTKC